MLLDVTLASSDKHVSLICAWLCSSAFREKIYKIYFLSVSFCNCRYFIVWYSECQEWIARRILKIQRLFCIMMSNQNEPEKFYLLEICKRNIQKQTNSPFLLARSGSSDKRLFAGKCIP